VVVLPPRSVAAAFEERAKRSEDMQSLILMYWDVFLPSRPQVPCCSGSSLSF